LKCFHHTDLDGHCSGAIVKMFYPDCEMFETDYEIPFPMETINDGEVVFLVDFGFDDTDMLKELNDRAQLYWIDHHRSTIEAANAAGIKVKGSQIVDKLSGCEQTWNFLAKDLPMPRTVFLLGRYDVWDHGADSAVLPFQYGLQAMDTLPENNMELWEYLLNTADDDIFSSDENTIEAITLRGEVIKQWVDQYNVYYANANAFTLNFEGHTWIAANNSGAGSDCAKAAFKPDVHQGTIIFGYKGRAKRWKVSFYTDPDSSLDCGAIAAKFGGGGHKEAAGCTVSKLPFKLPISMEDEVNR